MAAAEAADLGQQMANEMIYFYFFRIFYFPFLGAY